MRPEKSGPWLFEPAEGLVVNCVYITKAGRVLMPGSPVLWTIESFEQDSSVFVRWLGPANPPKKVKRYNLTQEYGSGGPTNDHYMAEGHRRSPGEWVRYDDVEEFLIK